MAKERRIEVSSAARKQNQHQLLITRLRQKWLVRTSNVEKVAARHFDADVHAKIAISCEKTLSVKDAKYSQSANYLGR